MMDITGERLVGVLLLVTEVTTVTCLSYSRQSLVEMPPQEALVTDGNHVDLSWNKITALPRHVFPASLHASVNLTRNQISYIDANAFGNSPRIRTLDLSHNLLSCLPSLYGLQGTLTQLSLAYNNLTNCTEEQKPTTLENLVRLDLRGNLLTQLYRFQLSPLPTLKALYLDDNCIGCERIALLRSTSRNKDSIRSSYTLSCSIQEKKLNRPKCKNINKVIPAGIQSIPPLNDTQWYREEWSLTLVPDLGGGGGYEDTTESTASPSDNEAVGPEMAFMTCIMIFVCTTCLGSVLYLGRKRRMADESSEYFSEYGSENNYDYNSGYNSYNSDSNSFDSYNSRSPYYSRRGSSYSSSERGSVY